MQHLHHSRMLVHCLAPRGGVLVVNPPEVQMLVPRLLQMSEVYTLVLRLLRTSVLQMLVPRPPAGRGLWFSRCGSTSASCSILAIWAVHSPIP